MKNLTIPTFLSGYFPSSAGGIGRCKRPGVGRGERRPTEGRGLGPKQAIRHLSQHLPKPGILHTHYTISPAINPIITQYIAMPDLLDLQYISFFKLYAIQGSRTIRTEEALLITLAALRPKIIQAQNQSS